MIKLLKKDLKLFLNDRRSVLLTFLLPLILITLFAIIYDGIGSTDNEPSGFTLLISDQDQSKLSKEVYARLDSLPGLELIAVEREHGEEQVSLGEQAALFNMGKGFSDSATIGGQLPVEFIYDRSREAEINIIRSVVSGAVLAAISEQRNREKLGSFLSENFPVLPPGDWQEKLAEAFPPGEKGIYIRQTSVLEKESNKNLGLIQAVAGTAIMMLLFSVAGIGGSILEEKENGTIYRLLYSPVRSDSILFSKMLFAFLVSIVQLVIMFLFAWLAFGLDLWIDIPSLLLMIIASAFAISGIGVLLAAISRTRQQSQVISTLVILVMSAIGGSMVPLFVMPDIMQDLAVISVNYWGIQGFYDIFWRSLPLASILNRIMVLAIIGLVSTIISIILYRKNIRKVTI